MFHQYRLAPEPLQVARHRQGVRNIRWQLRHQAAMHRQMLVLGIALFATGTMLMGIPQFTHADPTTDTNMAINVTSGALSLDNAPTQLNFTASSPGITTNANITTDGVISNDTRGSQAGWDVTGYILNNFYRASVPSTQMNIITRLRWFANSATIANITGADGEAVQGANANFNYVNESGNSLTLMSDSGTGQNGAGAFNLTNLQFNYDIPPGATPASDYKTTLRLTIA